MTDTPNAAAVVAADRAVVRVAVRAKLSATGQSTTLADGRNVSDLPRAELDRLACSLGIGPAQLADAAAVIARKRGQPVPATTTTTSGANAPDESEAMPLDNVTAPALAPDSITDETAAPAPDSITDETGPAPAPDVVERAVAEAMSPLGSGDVDGFRRNVAQLVAAALTPRVRTVTRERVRIVQAAADPAAPVAPAGEAPFAVRVGTAAAGKLFPCLPPRSVMAGKVMARWQSAAAPVVDADFAFPAEGMAGVLSALSRGRHVFLHGPAGTGKTTLAEQIAARTGREFCRISCTNTTEAQELVGMNAPAPGGGITWHDGQLARAIRRPGTVILIDEPSVARAGALFVLQAVLDSRRLHIAETGEVVPVAPGVLFVVADNTNGTGDSSGQYEDTGRLNRATLDRFAFTLRLGYLPPAAEAVVIQARTGCPAPLAVLLAGFAALTREAADKGDVSHGLGLRRLMALAEALADGVPLAEAWRGAVLETSTDADREHLDQLRKVRLTDQAIRDAMRPVAAAAEPVADARNDAARADFS